MNDINKLKEYSNPQNIKQLNVFEKCLLIYSLRNENKQLAHSIARQIRAECPKENQRELKRLFNIALNLKSIEEQKEEIEREEEAIIRSANRGPGREFARIPAFPMMN